MKRFKITLILLLFVLVLAIGIGVAACDDTTKTPDTYTLTFVTNGGTSIAPITDKAGATITPPANPIREGYVFKGWYLDKNFGGEAQTLPTVMPSENRTYYAKFELTTYTLTLDVNGGTLATTSYVVERGTKMEEFLKDIVPTRGELRFAGWYLGGRAVNANDVVEDNVTVVAQWEAYYTIEIYLQQLNAEHTAATDTYILSEEHSVSGWAKLGEEFSTSISMADYVIYSSHPDSVTSTVIGENDNVLKLYYKLRTHTVYYDANADGTHTGEMETEQYPHGAIVQLKDCAYSRTGYLFAAWSLDSDEFITPPTTAFYITHSYIIYALWDRGYVNEADANDVVYVSAVQQSGLGRAYRIENGVKTKEGFLEENENIPWVLEFTFYYDDGDQIGRIDTATGTFRYRGEEEGIYLCYDYATERYENIVMYLDGYGEAVWGTVDVAGGIDFGNNFGTYLYEATYGDYRFNYVDVSTQEETGDYFYFRVDGRLPDSAQGATGVAGTFIVQGYESGSYLLFEVFYSELSYSYALELDGYGNAREVYIDPQTGKTEILSEGIYRATDYYEDYMGEWMYVATLGTTDLSRFILNYVAYNDEYIPIYLKYDQALEGVLAAASGGDARLVLGGYNSAIYYPNGLGGNAIVGSFLISDDVNLSFTPYEDGMKAGLMLFVIDWTPQQDFIGTFTLNEDGFIVDADGTLTSYMGTSPYVEIPDRVTAIADDALNYNRTEVSLRMVIIPASVTSIGARAFENNYTLSQAVFLSTIPIQIDWSSAVNPFRWPKGDFVIIVPEGYEDVYRTAWADCPYKITSFAELNDRPVWEIEDGVLISYNNKDDNPRDLDLKIPDEVTEIAAKVFFALDYIRSIDLNNVVTIGADAFAQCTALVSVTAPQVQYIGSGAFALCTALESIYLPAVVTLGDEAFSGCYLLTRATLGENIAEIGAMAFAYCATDADDMIIFVVFEGSSAPTIGGNAFYGCVARRISVDTIKTALAFYNAAGWRSYILSLWVREAMESELVGEWVNLETLEPATFNGRAELFLIEVWLYELKGSSVTFYVPDNSAKGYSTISGTYKNGEISFKYDTLSYVLVSAEGSITYTCDNESLTLNLAEADYSAYPFIIPATFNGSPVTVSATFNGITAEAVINGRKCTVSFTLTNERTFTYTSRPNDLIGPFTASDGSVVSFRYSGSLIYATGTLTVDGNTITGTVGWVTTQESDTTFNISIPWRSTNYLVTVVITGDDVFTYSWAVGSTRKVISSQDGAGSVAIVYGKDGAITTLQLMLPEITGGANVTVESTYELQADGSYLFTVNFQVEKYDEATGSFYYEPSPLNGTYLVTIDFDSETCNIIKTA
ncbi:MAG: InlB B-repeat-containing protein [Clostridiales bacterium]|nr:InlB B-repeat-containing protein [Clostridiales bacterium]